MYLTAILQISFLLALFETPTQASEMKNSTNRKLTRSDITSVPSLPGLRNRLERTPFSSSTQHRFSRRDDVLDDDLVARHIQIVTSTVPIADAVNALQVFYNSILYNALAPWGNMEPQVALRMTMGCLELTMEVVSDRTRTRRGIPWAFVRNFARNMLTMTTMGFTGTYDMYYSTNLGYYFNPDLGVEVHLRVLWGA